MLNMQMILCRSHQICIWQCWPVNVVNRQQPTVQLVSGRIAQHLSHGITMLEHSLAEILMTMLDIAATPAAVCCACIIYLGY